MEFKEVLLNRHSVRDFEPRELERSVVRSLIDAAILAPSAKNDQPWEFWVILGHERVEECSIKAKDWLANAIARGSVTATTYQRLHIADPSMSLLYHAPALVLITARSPDAQADEDCCLAAVTLLLAARDAGMGSCWIGSTRTWFNLPETKRELGIPDGAQVVAPIILGYPKEWPKSHSRNPASIHWLTKG